MEGVTAYLHVRDWPEGVKFYTALLGREPDRTPDYGVAEWELVPRFTLRVVGNPADPLHLRIHVARVKDVFDRAKAGLGLEPGGDFWKYGTNYITYTDPWGNCLAFESREREDLR